MKKFFITALLVLLSLMMYAQRCAVLDFQIGTGVTIDDIEGITHDFRTNFQPAGYTILERNMINTTINEMSYTRTDMTQQQMLRVGRYLDASIIVIGTLNIFMDEYSVDIRVINVSTGVTIATEGATFERVNHRSSMESIAKQLSSKLSSKLSPIVENTHQPIEEVQLKNEDKPIILYNYLTVFPKDLGAFSSVPRSVIDKINESLQYGFGTWRLPTEEELSLMLSSGIIEKGRYMTMENPDGLVRLVTDRAKGVIIPRGYVDLGLPSGVLWKEENEPAMFTFNQAIREFDDQLPSKQDYEELMSNCRWTWNGNRYTVTGPNGNIITFPLKKKIDHIDYSTMTAAQRRAYDATISYSYSSNTYGDYLSSTQYNSLMNWYFHFAHWDNSIIEDDIEMRYDRKADEYAVRIIKRL